MRDQVLQTLLVERFLMEAQFVRQDAVEDRAPDRCRFGFILRRQMIVVVAEQNRRVQFDDAEVVQILDLVHVHDHTALVQVRQFELVLQDRCFFISLLHLVGVGEHAVDFAFEHGADGAVNRRLDDLRASAFGLLDAILEHHHVGDVVVLRPVVAVAAEGDTDLVFRR